MSPCAYREGVWLLPAQVRKLGQGFDHRFLADAAVFSIFANLSPFVQFVGPDHASDRAERATKPAQSGCGRLSCRGERRQPMGRFEADKEIFDQLLPVEGLDFSSGDEIEVEPVAGPDGDAFNVRSQTGVQLEEIPLLRDDPEAVAAVRFRRPVA